MGKKKAKPSDDDYFSGLGAPTAEPEPESAPPPPEPESEEDEQVLEAELHEEDDDEAEAEEDEAVAEATPRAAPRASPAAAPAPAAGDADGALAQLLLRLRPFGPGGGGGALMPYALAALLKCAWSAVSRVAPPATLLAVEQKFAEGAGERAAAAAAGEAAARASSLYDPVSERWVARGAPCARDDGDAVASLRFNAERACWERWYKNLATKTKADKSPTKKKRAGDDDDDAPAAGAGAAARAGGMWVRAKAWEGWASAPAKLTTDDEFVGDSDVQFFVCVPASAIDPSAAAADEAVFECTAWVESHLMLRDAARGLGMVDVQKPVLELGLGDKGIEGAVLARVQALAAASNDDDGGARGKPAKKEKLSRAEKKEKKKAYGR